MAQSLILHTPQPESQLELVQDWIASQASNQPQSSLEANTTVVNPDGALTISQVRHVLTASQYQPYQSGVHRYVVLQAETASIPAQNALLKVLEEPPSHSQIILASHQPGQLLPTIQSRCVMVRWPEALEEVDVLSLSLTVLPADWQTLGTAHYTDLIQLAAKLSDRAQAIQELQTLAQLVHGSNHHPSATTTTCLKILSEAVIHLQANVNVKLAVENCLFQLKQRASKTKKS